VSASGNRTLEVWDIASGSLVRTLEGHTNITTCVDVSPGNTRILSASHNGT
jgi:COMPASS component SWD3